jgi:hypothetical protein
VEPEFECLQSRLAKLLQLVSRTSSANPDRQPAFSTLEMDSSIAAITAVALAAECQATVHTLHAEELAASVLVDIGFLLGLCESIMEATVVLDRFEDLKHHWKENESTTDLRAELETECMNAAVRFENEYMGLTSMKKTLMGRICSNYALLATQLTGTTEMNWEEIVNVRWLSALADES